MPYELPFIAVTEQAFTRLVNEQYALLQRSIAAQERLQRIVLAERGLDAIVGALAGARRRRGARLRRPRRARRRSARSAATLDADVVRGLGEELRERARRGESRELRARTTPSSPPRALALPVGGRDVRRARGGGCRRPGSSRSRTRGGLAEIDRLILHQAVTVVALELLRRRVADTTERRLAGDVLSAVVAGDLEGPELARRLEPFGLGGRVTALVLADRARRRCRGRPPSPTRCAPRR